MQLKENARLQSGKYRIIRVLGQGGFGITYLAENTMLGKQVAIKEFFPKDFCGRDNTSHLTLGTQNNADTVSKLKARFIKEAQNIVKLDHPGIVHIYDVFEENNTAYYVMDYIEGENLNEMVKRNGPLLEDKAVSYIKKVGEALDYIHSRNMTHFDVKPANIVVRKADDQPILIDFGLSKQYDSQGDATSTLMQGVSQGYSPLELYNYGSVSSFSPQTDVYSLAATLFYLLSGKVPPAPTEIMENGITFPDSVPSNLKRSIAEAMQSNRKNRPSSVYAFIEGIDSQSDLITDTSSPEDTVYIDNKNASSNHPNSIFLWYVIAGIIIAAIILFAIFNPFNHKQNDNAHDYILANEDSVVVVEEVVEDSNGVKIPVSVSEPIDYYSNSFHVNEIGYTGSFNITAENGTLTANVRVNGDTGIDKYMYSTNISASQAFDLFQGLVYYEAAATLADRIVPDEGDYNEEFLQPTLRLLKKSADCFSRSRGNDPTAYDGAISRYKMLSKLNPNNDDDRGEIATIAWGMGEHPIYPRYLKYVSSR